MNAKTRKYVNVWPPVEDDPDLRTYGVYRYDCVNWCISTKLVCASDIITAVRGVLEDDGVKAVRVAEVNEHRALIEISDPDEITDIPDRVEILDEFAPKTATTGTRLNAAIYNELLAEVVTS